eukprot:397813-Alexandrium_andersonii.AAC.1
MRSEVSVWGLSRICGGGPRRVTRQGQAGYEPGGLAGVSGNFRVARDSRTLARPSGQSKPVGPPHLVRGRPRAAPARQVDQTALSAALNRRKVGAMTIQMLAPDAQWEAVRRRSPCLQRSPL